MTMTAFLVSCDHNNPNGGRFGADNVTCDYTPLGTYNATVAVPDLDPEDPIVEQPEVTLEDVSVIVADCAYSSENLWGNFADILSGQDLGEDYYYPANIIINDDNSVTVTSEVQPGGEGTYNPKTETFHLTLEQEVFQGDFTVDVTMTKAELEEE